MLPPVIYFLMAQIVFLSHLFYGLFEKFLHIFISHRLHFILKILSPGYIMYKEVVNKHFRPLSHESYEKGR